MRDAYICDAARTPIGRYGGALAKVRTDDLAATPMKALVKRNPQVDWSQVDEVFLGCANQAGEDNRNVARMALLLAGLPDSIGGVTLNRLCASGLEATGAAARAIRAGEMDLAIAGGVESMTRAPFVMGKAPEAFPRSAEMYDTTIGWRFVNPLMKKLYGTDSMPETAQNVADEYQVSREDQDAFALRSQQRAAKAQANGAVDEEIVPVEVRDRKGAGGRVVKDEHPRPETIAEALASIGAAVSARALDPEAGVVGLDNHTTFLRAARAGTEILAEARPLHAGRRTQTWDVTMRDPDGRELAVSRVRLLVWALSALPHGRFP